MIEADKGPWTDPVQRNVEALDNTSFRPYTPPRRNRKHLRSHPVDTHRSDSRHLTGRKWRIELCTEALSLALLSGDGLGRVSVSGVNSGLYETHLASLGASRTSSRGLYGRCSSWCLW